MLVVSNTVSKTVLLSLVLSLGVLVSFVPALAAMENDGKEEPEVFCWVDKAAYEKMLKQKSRDQEAANFFMVVKNGDFNSASNLIDAGSRDAWTAYTVAILQFLQKGEAGNFKDSRMQVQLAERLLDKCAQDRASVEDYIWDYIDHNNNRIALLELALARIWERHRNGVDSSDYERLAKKLISLRIPLYEETQILNFSGERQLQALDLVDPAWRDHIQVEDFGGWEDKKCDDKAFLSEQRLIKRAKERPVNLEWLKGQCPPKNGEIWSCEDAYNNLLRSYLVPYLIPNDLAGLVLEYHDVVVDAAEPVPYDARLEDENSGSGTSARRAFCESCVIL